MKKVAVNTELGMFRGHSQSDNEKDVIDSLPQSSYQAQYSLHPAHPSSSTFSMPVQKMSVPLDINKVIIFAVILILLSVFVCPFSFPPMLT